MVYRPYYLAREWIKLGHKVKIISASYSHVRNFQPKVADESIDGISYHWIKTPHYHSNNLKRVINILVFCSKLGFELRKVTKKFKPDVIISSSTHNLDIYVANYFAKKFKAKLIYEVRDLWPLSPIEIGGMSEKNPWIRLIAAAEKFAYKKSYLTVSLLPKAFEYMATKGLTKEKFRYIPNGFSFDEIKNAKKDKRIIEKIKKIKVNCKLLIGYTGAVGEANALEYIIDAIGQFRSQEIALVIVGDGLRKTGLEARAKQFNNIHFFAPIEKNKIFSIIDEFDLMYIGLKKCRVFRYGVSPNKLFDYMACGKPIISAVTAGNDLVSDANCGFSVQAENTKQLSTALRKALALDKKSLKKLGANGKIYAQRHYNYTKIAKEYINQINSKNVKNLR